MICLFTRSMRVGATLALVGASLVGPSRLQAQQGLSFEGRAGVALPIGRLESLVDPGPSVGLRLGYPIGNRFRIGLSGEMDLFKGVTFASGPGPDLAIRRYTAGLEASLLDPQARRLSLLFDVGVGAATFDTDEFTVPPSSVPEDFSKTYLTSGAGLRLGYQLSPRVQASVGAAAHWASIPSADTERLQQLDSTIKSLNSAWSVPITFGIRVSTGRRAPAPPPPAQAPQATVAPQPSPAPPPADAGAEERAAALEILRERVHFDFDLATIRPEAAAALDRKIEVLRRYPNVRVLIEGHCDELGSVEYNQALGNRRSTAVLQYLVNAGIAESRLETTSYGEERPLVTVQNEAGWAQNRRAEFVVLNPEAIASGE